MNIFQETHSNLEKTKEMWIDKSIEEVIKANSEEFRLPRKAIRKLVIPIKDSNNIKDLRKVVRSFKIKYNLVCFQCSIDRINKKAYFLFDFLNKETGKSFVFNVSEQKIMYALIKVILGNTDDDQIGKRYILMNYYHKNQGIYRELLKEVGHQHVSKHSYRILDDILRYVEDMCERRVK